MLKTWILFVISFLFIVLDQVTKLLVKGFDIFGVKVEGFYYGEIIPVFGDTLALTFVENPGMAFGIEFGVGKIFLSLFSVFAGVGLSWYLYKIKFANNFVRIAIMLILAGAVGNMIDRVFYGVIFGESALFYGKVVDFILVDIPDVFGMSHWPVFNVADSCVSVGIVLLVFFNNKLPSISEAKIGAYIVSDDNNDKMLDDEFVEPNNSEL